MYDDGNENAFDSLNSFGSDDGLQQLYQQFILEQARDPHGKTSLADSLDLAGSKPDQSGSNMVTNGQSHQFNPTCGDDITVRVTLTSQEHGDSSTDSPVDPSISSLQWGGNGCAICLASLSVMHDMVTGCKISRFSQLLHDFRLLMDSRGRGVSDPKIEDDLADALSFTGVARFPLRIKCALLGWEATNEAIAQAQTHMRQSN